MESLVNSAGTATERVERFFSVAEVAAILKVSEVTIYRGINAGQFPAIKIRGRYVVPSKVLDQLETAALEQVETRTPDPTWMYR
jgi:excisionase family DNA binding protein